MIAIPLISDPVLAAVAVVFGTLSVAVSVICILFGSTFKTLLATCNMQFCPFLNVQYLLSKC